MGVAGLTSYVEDNPHLLSRFVLHDTELVIDGNSFMYNVYYMYRIDTRCGGEYSRFAAIVGDLLDVMARCKVRPVFVMDGLLDMIATKFQTAADRHRLRMGTAKNIGSKKDDRYVTLLPLFVDKVLLEVLTERRVEFVQCSGEADAVVARLANDRQAPVLSQDSDFFVFDLQYGYIPFPTVNWHAEDVDYIPARRYLLQNLLHEFPKLERRLLPLFAALCGNDFIKSLELSSFHTDIERSEMANRTKRARYNATSSFRQKHIPAILRWLSRQSDEYEAVNYALMFVDDSRQAELRDQIQQAADAYRRCLSNIQQTNCYDAFKWIHEDLDRLGIPHWAIEGYTKGWFPQMLLLIRQDQFVFLKTLVEDFSQPDAYDSTLPLRLCAYDCLLKNSDKRTVTELGRNGGQMVQKQVNLNDADHCPLSAIEQLAELSVDERRKLFLSCFQFEQSDMAIIDELCDSVVPFACSLLYWRRHTELVRRQHVCALLFYVLANEPTFSSRELGVKLETKLFKQPTFQYVDGKLWTLTQLHVFSQWQACYQATDWLHALLMRPFGDDIAPVHHLFSGKAVFNLFKKFSKFKSLESALQSLLANNTKVIKDLFRLYQSVLAALPDDATVEKISKKPIVKKTPLLRQTDFATSDVFAETTRDESDDDGVWCAGNPFAALKKK